MIVDNYQEELSFIVGDTHRLLEPPPQPAYSNLTVRRAFIVWMYCGQKNKFKDVCNYYHRLEALEETMTPEACAASRHLEFQLFSNRPPKSDFLRQHFPDLYPPSLMDPYYVTKLEAIKNNKCVFRLEGFHKLSKSGCTSKEISEISKMVRLYCQTRYISPRQFLEEFLTFAKKNNVDKSVSGVAYFITKKESDAEQLLLTNFPKTFDFLEDESEFYNGPETEAVCIEETQSVNLKEVLGINKKKVKAKAKSKAKLNESDTCTEFFKLFADKPKFASLSQLPQSFEDFAKALYENRGNTGSVENVIENGVKALSLEVNQSMHDSRTNEILKG